MVLSMKSVRMRSAFAESEEGRGSRFFFRLPKGVVRVLLALLLAVGGNSGAMASVRASAAKVSAVASSSSAFGFKELMTRANAYADSAYYSNVNGSYRKTVAFADSCLQCLNAACVSLKKTGKNSPRLLTISGDYPAKAAELTWFRDCRGCPCPTSLGFVFLQQCRLYAALPYV